MYRLKLMCADRSQSGQALIETLVFAAVAAVLMTGILMLGRLQSIQQATSDTARSVASECRLLGARCDDPRQMSELVSAVQSRYFSAQGRASWAEPSADASTVEAGTRPDPHWVNPDGSPMLGSPQAVAVRSSALRLDAGVSTASAGQTSIAQSLRQFVGPDRFGLDPHGGFRVATVEAPVRWSIDPLNSGDAHSLTLRARLAVVGDAWNATETFGPSDDSLESRVVRGSKLDRVRETTLQAGYALSRGALGLADSLGLEPNGRSLTGHRLDVSIIPGDRRP